MEPRLGTSKKSTDFPPDYVRMIEKLVHQNFKKVLKGHSVHVAGKLYNEEIVTQIGFREKGSIRQFNFESSVEYSTKPNNIMDQIYLSIDALGSMISQYFEAEGDIEMPKTWFKFEMEGKEVFLRMTGENPELEAQADEILNQGRPENEGANEAEAAGDEDKEGQESGEKPLDPANVSDFELKLKPSKKPKKSGKLH